MNHDELTLDPRTQADLRPGGGAGIVLYAGMAV